MAKKNLKKIREKRERNEKRNAELKSQRNKQNIKKAIIISAVAIVLIVALSFCITAFYDSGIMLRSRTAIESDNYEINNAMMSYYLYKNINTELDTYGYYYQYYYNLSLTQSLKSQSYNDEMTWFDYFLSNTVNEIATVLLLAEHAKDNGMALDADELAAVDEAVHELEHEAEDYGISLEEHIEERFGRGVKESDIREAIEIYNLANKNYEQIIASFTYTDEELQAHYDANTKNFLYADYKYYVFDSEEAANKAAAAKTAEEFGNVVKEYLAAYKDADGNGYTEDEIKQKIWDTAAYAYTYNVDDDFGKWAFDESRKAGDTTVISADTGKYTAYFMMNPAHRLEETKNVRHILVSFESYETHADALVQANAILDEYRAGTQGEEAFDALAQKYNEDSSSLYENVRPGYMVTPFNDWCYDEARKAGDVDVVESEFGYHIMYFVGDGETAWKADVKDALNTDAYTAFLDQYVETYPIEFHENNLYKLPGDVAVR